MVELYAIIVFERSVMSTFKKRFLTSVGVTIGIIAIFVAGTIVLGADLGARADRIQNMRITGTERSQAIQSLAVLKEEATRAEQYQSLLETALPTKDDIFNFRSRARAVATDAGVTLGFKFGAEEPATANMPAAVNFQMTVSGSTNHFLDFLRRLEESGYFYNLNVLDLTYTGKGANLNIQATLGGKVFSR